MTSLWPVLNVTVTLADGSVIPPAGAAFSSITQELNNLLRDAVLATSDPRAGTSVTPVPIPTASNGSVIDVRYFGALGDGNQTLYATIYTSDVAVTQQTYDGMALNRAIVYLRSIGGGALYIPRGEYRVYQTLESIDFDCQLLGDGPGITVIKSCDSTPTNTQGYGLLRCGEQSISAYSSEVRRITIRDITLDGNGNVRAEPPAEYRNDNLALYSIGKYTLDNIESLNAVRDCLLTAAESEGSTLGPAYQAAAKENSLVATNCRFDTSFRNSVSLVGGDNQKFVNCDFLNGGYVHEGTLPRACLDIECDGAAFALRNLQFANCRFQRCRNIAIGIIWSQAKFDNCRIVLEGETVGTADDDHPWPFSTRDSLLEFNGCEFYNLKTTGVGAFRSRCYTYPTGVFGAGPFSAIQRTTIRNCSFEGVGFYQQGKHSVVMENVTFRNSLFPVVFDQTDVDSSVILKNVTLTNVGDSVNTFGGAFAALIFRLCAATVIDISGLLIQFDSKQLPADVGTSTWKGSFGTGRAYGLYFVPVTTSKSSIKMCDVHVKGYWRTLPTYYGVALNGSNFRDIIAGGTTAQITAPADATTFAPGTIYFRNVTEHGDAL